MGRHLRNIGAANARHIFGNAQGGIHAVDPIDKGLGRKTVLRVSRRETGHASKIGKLGGGGVTISAKHVRQDDRVGQTVRNSVSAAQTVRDGMDISDIGAGKCNTRFIRRRKHIATSAHVVAMLIGLGQIVVDELDRLTRHLARVGRGATADKGLDGMRQGIHARLPRNGGGQAACKLGVVHRKARDKHKVVNGVFIVRLVIGDNRRECDFASRTGGSGNRNKQRQETVDAQQAAHLVDGLIWLCDACAHALGAVHGRTAAKTDNGPAVVLAIQRRRFLHIRDRGVRTRFGIDRNANPLSRKRTLE